MSNNSEEDQKSPSDDEYLTEEGVKKASNLLHKTFLFHEMFLNKPKMILTEDLFNFYIDEDRVKLALEELYSENGSLDNLHYILNDIKEKLSNLVLKDKSYIRDRIDQDLNLDSLTREKIPEILSKIIGIMRISCAPVRDEALKEIENLSDSVQIVEKMYKFLQLMYLDMTNFIIAKLKEFPYEYAVRYEREKFTEILKELNINQTDGLEKTKKWILKANDSLEFNLKMDKKKEYILPAGFVLLLHWEDDRSIPETLSFDFKRIRLISLDYHIYLICLALTTLSANMIKEKLESVSCNDLKATNYDLLRIKIFNGIIRLLDSVNKDTSQPLGIFLNKLTEKADDLTSKIAVIIHDFLDKNLKAIDNLFGDLQASETFEIIEKELTKHVWKIVNRNHPVYNLLKQRADQFLVKLLESENPFSLPLPSGLILSSNISEVPLEIKTGIQNDQLEEDSKKRFTQFFKDICTNVLPIYRFNNDIFKDIYASVIQKIEI